MPTVRSGLRPLRKFVVYNSGVYIQVSDVYYNERVDGKRLGILHGVAPRRIFVVHSHDDLVIFTSSSSKFLC